MSKKQIDLAKLSPDKMRKLLEKTLKEKLELEAKNRGLEKRVKDDDKIFGKLTKDNNRKDNHLALIDLRIGEALDRAKDAGKYLKKSVIVYDDFIGLDFFSQCTIVFAEFIEQSRQLANLQKQFCTGNESVKPAAQSTNETQQRLNSLERKAYNVVKVSRRLSAAMLAQRKAIEAAQGTQSPTINSEEIDASEAAKRLSTLVFPNNQIEPQTPKGRQKTTCDAPEKKLPDLKLKDGERCRFCESTNLSAIGKTAHRVKETAITAYAEASVLEYASDIAVCEDCHCAHVVVDDSTALPCEPKRQLGMDAVASGMLTIASGHSLNGAVTSIQRVFHLGSNTVSLDIHDCTRDYLMPIYDLITQKIGDTPYLLADGTPMPCLQDQGRGRQPDPNSKRQQQAAKAAAAEAEKPSAQEPSQTAPSKESADGKSAAESKKESGDKKAESQQGKKTSSKNYILSLTTPLYAELPLVYYSYCPSRSVDNMAKVFKPTFVCKGLCADAYSGYDRLFDQYFADKVERQSDWTHWRRAILIALGVKKQSKELYIVCRDSKDLEAKILDAINRKDPGRLLLAVLVGVNYLYSIEKANARKEGESEEDYFKRIAEARRTKSLPVAKLIDIVMQELSKDRVEYRPNKAPTHAYKRKKNSDVIAPVCVYYLNQKENLWRFLTDPRQSMTSNLVESRLRGFTVLRKNSYFKQSPEYAVDACVLLTIVRTLELNHVDPAKWLRSYMRAVFLYCVDKAWTIALANGHDPQKHLISYDMKKLREGFFFEKWVPWNCREKLPDQEILGLTVPKELIEEAFRMD